jgi:hypothetical protein
MDHLVKEITENLKLGSAAADLVYHDLDNHVGPAKNSSFKLKTNFRRGVSHHRSSPYAVPPSSRACDTTLGSSPKGPSQLRKWNHQRRRYPSTCMNNPPGAGKKVDEDPEDPFQMLQELISDGSLIKEAVRRLQKGLYPTATPTGADNKTFYDSEDDECGLTPPNLCCDEVGL